MRSSFFSLAVAVGFAAAQSQLDKIPKCAFSCVSSYISGTNIAGCKPADIACVCKNQEFINGISCCLQKDCSKEEVDSTISFANQLCTASGVETPKQLVCSAGSASASGSAAATKTSTSTSSSNSTPAGSQQTTTTSSGSGTAATGAAVPAFGNAGGILGVALAIAAAL
ncbi:CFEM domain protein [Metarhizium rileyi]|uniref:CFEM domain protein n=1 Tax=Metarhizium rileyi (strain RCEF 4871) TaxID=1649241 RepID=A0A167I6U8_METRR|nr:CFEM domain protein [Metarhizium rileyi RCEF 4871]TWU74549.1 hypothetical protein ED733_006192 [Metarhizium rileyi]